MPRQGLLEPSLITLEMRLLDGKGGAHPRPLIPRRLGLRLLRVRNDC